MRGQIHGLRGVENHHGAAIIPGRDRRVGLDRVVVEARRPVNMTDADLRLSECLVDIADLDFRRFARMSVGTKALDFAASNEDFRASLAGIDRYERCAMLRLLQCFGYHQGHRLTIPVHVGILHDRRIAQRKALADVVEVHDRWRFPSGEYFGK